MTTVSLRNGLIMVKEDEFITKIFRKKRISVVYETAPKRICIALISENPVFLSMTLEEFWEQIK
jgi:hypothetical protein